MSTTQTIREPRSGERPFITVQSDDPFQTLFMPSYQPGQQQVRSPGFATTPIDSRSKVQTYLPPTVQPTFSDPLLEPTSTLASEYVPKDEYHKAKRSGARDGWTAAALLAAFVAGGIWFVVDRIGADAAQIGQLSGKVDALNNQLNSERGVVIARNQEIKLLQEQLITERKKNTKKW